MIINRQNLSTLFNAFNAAFTKGEQSAASNYKSIAMVVPSASASETYGWMGQFPQMREWIGDRIIRNLSTSSYSVVNKLYESTVAVPKADIEDDVYGVFSPIMNEMGKAAAEKPDELIFAFSRKASPNSATTGNISSTSTIPSRTRMDRSPQSAISQAAPARRGSFSIAAGPSSRWSIRSAFRPS